MQIVRRVLSRRRLLLAVTLTVFACLALIVTGLESLYTATAEILIEAPAAQPTNPLQAATLQAADREKVMSEVQVLLSRGLAEKTVREFELAGKPEFNSALSASFASRLQSLLGAKSTPSEVTDRLMSRLNVFQIGTSRVISVQFTSSDPILARDVANRIADFYIEDQRQSSVDVNARARDWLSEQIDGLRARVAESEAKAEAFRARSGLLEGNGVQLQGQQLSELSTQLSTARSARTEAQARATTLQRLASSNLTDARAESDLSVLQSPLIQQLRQQEVELKREVTEMSSDLLPTHPRMVQKQAELENLETQIRSEIAKVIASVRNEAQVASVRENGVQRELRELEGRRAIADRDQIELRALEREAAANRSVLESFLGRYTEISTRGDISIQDTSARVISRAETPDRPSFPQRTPMLTLAGMIAFAFGLGAVFTAEMTDQSIRHVRDVELASGVPMLAALPDGSIANEALPDTNGAFADGLRALHMGLDIVPADGRRGRIIAVTSTGRGEGRTTTAIGFARSMAQSGLRVLLVDADFGNPDLEHAMGRKLPWGFRDLVAGRAGFGQVIVRDHASDAHVMSAGHAYRTSVLSSPRFKFVLQGLVHTYDAMVIDCGPASTSDAQFLMRVADQCLYAVRWNTTNRESAVAGLRQISAARRRGGLGLVVTGAALSQVA